MAGLKVFVSSTCYDLSIVRSQLRIFIQNIGHEPVMSDYNDILYDPRIHTHSSCVDEVASCDVVILIVGQRFGGKTVPEALNKIDLEFLYKESKSTDSLKKKENLSVTQLEILKAVEAGIPVFTFIDNGVWHDHATYEKNKDKGIISDIEFPSIQKPDTAAFIFEFINFLRHRARGNSVFPFSKLQDIEEVLKKQWSSLFQKLLQEQRNRVIQGKRLDDLTDQFEDLKTAILTSIGTSNEREVARGVVRFRKLMDFVRALGLKDMNFVLQGRQSWEDLLSYADIVETLDAADFPKEFAYQRRGPSSRPRFYLIKKDQTFYEVRMSQDFFHGLSLDWAAFMELSEETRGIIVDALSEMRVGLGPIRYIREEFENHFKKWIHQENLQINMSDIDVSA